MMHACHALRGHAMALPKTKTPLAREGKIMRESRQCTHIHFFFSLSTPLLHNCLLLHDVVLEIVETVDSRQ